MKKIGLFFLIVSLIFVGRVSALEINSNVINVYDQINSVQDNLNDSYTNDKELSSNQKGIDESLIWTIFGIAYVVGIILILVVNKIKKKIEAR